MSEKIDTHKQLKIQQGIRQAEDQLVIWIQSALDKKESYGDLEESQFRNLVRVSDTTESPEVIKNFLRYQVGRDKKWGRGKESLAETIVSDIGTYGHEGKLIKLAEKIAKKVKDDINAKNDNDDNNVKSEHDDPSQINAIWIELIRRYLGYGARYLKYLRDGNKG